MSIYLKTQRVLGYDDVIKYEAGNSQEPLVDIRKYDKSIVSSYIKKDMLPITGDIIYVREAIAKKIARVEKQLSKRGYVLKVVYGYRHPSVQKRYFTERKAALRSLYPNLTENQLNKYTHGFVAVPDIAGHPAGAAVDLTIADVHGLDIDMGTAIADYSDEDKIKTFADHLTPQQVKNRQMLHDAMIGEQFAPFYGEWWHFSYGDREWAAFYNKKALYGAIDFSKSV